MAEQVAIIGDGQMGLVLADALAWAGVPATIWGPFPENVSHLATHRENPGRFPGYRLPDAIQVEVEAEAALAGATLAINAIPICCNWAAATACIMPSLCAEIYSTVVLGHGIWVEG